MTLTDRIHEAAARYEVQAGQKPNVIYVGMREEGGIMRIVAELEKLEPPRQIAGYGPRPKFAGMEIYRVNATEHLACGRV